MTRLHTGNLTDFITSLTPFTVGMDRMFRDLEQFSNTYTGSSTGYPPYNIEQFDDGKWVLSVYVTNIEASKESIYLMRQLNVALNRDINKLKRVIFYSNSLLERDLQDIKSQYPRV